MMHRAVLLAAVALVGCGSKSEGSAPRDLPALTERVVDKADLLPPDQEGQLIRALAAAEKKTRAQFVVVTLPSLNGRRIEDVGVALGREWGIGRNDVNDGVMLIVAPTERRVRIEVGYGLEGVLRDEEAKAIITDRIMPRFKQGDMAAGIMDGSAAIIREIDVPGATP
jgi:uncharacterized protein